MEFKDNENPNTDDKRDETGQAGPAGNRIDHPKSQIIMGIPWPVD